MTSRSSHTTYKLPKNFDALACIPVREQNTNKRAYFHKSPPGRWADVSKNVWTITAVIEVCNVPDSQGSLQQGSKITYWILISVKLPVSIVAMMKSLFVSRSTAVPRATVPQSPLQQ